MRKPWDTYFLEIAELVSTRSTCERKQVGAVLVLDKRIIATGYCGSLPGQQHCIDVGCDIDPATSGCVRTVHAEINTLAQCASHGIRTEGATCYLTLSPCGSCFKAMAMAGIARIVYSEQYRIPPNFALADALGIEMKRVQKTFEEQLEVKIQDYIYSFRRDGARDECGIVAWTCTRSSEGVSVFLDQIQLDLWEAWDSGMIDNSGESPRRPPPGMYGFLANTPDGALTRYIYGDK